MTLILTVANPRAVYQSSDFQLTDVATGAPISDRAGSKQLEASFKTLQVQLAFTGIATVGSGASTRRTIDWLSNELKALGDDARVQDICDALARRSTDAMKVHGARGALTLILTFATIGEPFRVALISNVNWRKRPPEARPTFSVDIHTITKPFVLISGYRASVPARERHRLKAIARAIEKSSKDVLEVLATTNAMSAKNSGGYVSEGCWVTSQFADGRVRRSTALNVGQHQGNIPQLSGGIDLSEWVEKNVRAAPGKEIRLVQSASVLAGPGDGVPVPPPHGDPRRFTIGGSTAVGSLRSPSGDHCASLEAAQLNCVLHARRNQAVVVEFGRVVMSGVSGARCAPFSRPLLPWPTVSPELAIDNVAVPRGWEYTVGYWIDGETHRVTIPTSSRSIRNIAFLSEDDELVIVVPTTTVELAWKPSQGPAVAALEANVWWRARLDGTRG